jgi:hypothetical protein
VIRTRTKHTEDVVFAVLISIWHGQVARLNRDVKAYIMIGPSALGIPSTAHHLLSLLESSPLLILVHILAPWLHTQRDAASKPTGLVALSPLLSVSELLTMRANFENR